MLDIKNDGSIVMTAGDAGHIRIIPRKKTTQEEYILSGDEKVVFTVYSINDEIIWQTELTTANYADDKLVLIIPAEATKELSPGTYFFDSALFYSANDPFTFLHGRLKLIDGKSNKAGDVDA